MFNQRALLVRLLFVIALTGCSPSNEPKLDTPGQADASPGRDSSVPTQILEHTGTLSGLVVDVNGNRIGGAAVATGALTVETDEQGEFDFDEVEASEDATLIVTRDGYSTGRLPLTVLEAYPNHVRVTLQRAEVAMLADPSAGGDVQTESGVTFKLAPGQIVDENGNAVTDPVEIMIALINDRDEMAASPGGMMAIDPEAETDEPPTQLESFGMVEVSMSAGGKTVQLKEGSEVELEFPLAPHHPFNEGDTVGLWHFDEGEEVWKNDGEGTVTDQNKMKSLVGHFSWWNADQVLTKTCVLGRVLDADGQPVPGANLTAEGRSYLGSSYAMADAEGEFCLEARVSSVIDVSTLVRVGNEEQALAVRVNTPRTIGSCRQPSSCFMLAEDLVAVAPQQLCDPAQCPADPGGKQACCISDLGPCSFVVNGDCGGEETGAWDEPTGEPGVGEIPGVPMGTAPMSMMDAGMDAGTPDASVEPTMDASVEMDASTTMDAATEEDASTGTAGQGGASGSGGSGGSGAAGTGGGSDAGNDDGGTGTGGTGGSDDGGTGTGGTGGTGAGPDGGTDDGGTGSGGTGGQAGTDGGADAATPACGPGYQDPCIQCLMRQCDSEVAACMGDQWQDGVFAGPCSGFGQCICDSPTEDTTACESPEFRTLDCNTCLEPANACASTNCAIECGDSGSSDGGVSTGGMSGGSGSGGTSGDADGGTQTGGSGGTGGGSGGTGGDGGGGGSIPVDRCADVIAATPGTIEGATDGSDALTDWYEGNCNAYLPGYDRTYSIEVGPGQTLRARVTGPDMTVLISTDCADINGSCQMRASTASFENMGPSPQTVFVTVDSSVFDAQTAFTLLLSTDEPFCGDAIVDWFFGESCDDGAIVGGDGCSEQCQIEPGWICPIDGDCRQVVCGDGLIDNVYGGGTGGDPMADGGTGSGAALPEQCDDEGTADGDGCSSTCQIEAGYACNGVPSVCQVRPGGDLCSNPLPLAPGGYNLANFNNDYNFEGPDMLFSYSVPAGQVLQIAGTAAFDGAMVVMFGNECPYGRGFYHWLELGVPFNVAVDPAEFFGEVGPMSDVVVLFSANSSAPDKTFMIDSAAAITPVCGDGVLTRSNGEECDDGGPTSGDGCSDTCQVEPGYVCPGSGPCRPVVCGDGMVDWPYEDCEDGDTQGGDGCGADCRTEPGYLCDFEMGVCETRPSGDLCNNAETLPYGFFQNSYDLQGMTSDYLNCSGCDITRWFAVEQQPGDITTVLIVSDFYGYMSFVEPACPSQNGGPSAGMGGSFGPGYMLHRFLRNDTGLPRTLWLQIGSNGAEQTGTFELITKTGPIGCGDGVRDGYGGEVPPDYEMPPGDASGSTEGCDDMNNVDGDGCSAECQREFGAFRCPYEGGPCSPAVCGDGVIDQGPGMPYEECDDGDSESGDGCSASCLVEAGALCSGNPSQCIATPPGDVCSNALALPLGMSSHSLDMFNASDNCNDMCGGKDMWFTHVLPPRAVLDIQLSSGTWTQARLFGSMSGDCRARYDMNGMNAYFGPGQPANLHQQNDTNQPITVFMVVGGGEMGGQFDMVASSQIPTLDCNFEPCADVVCGDGVVNGTEQCDDDETVPGDGCGSNCVLETGFACFGQPSTCQQLLAGDRCEIAEPLSNGTFSLEGYTSDPTCTVGCESPTRWFHVDVPAFHTVAVTASSADMNFGQLAVYDLSKGPCHQLAWSELNMSINQTPNSFAWINRDAFTRSFAVVVHDGFGGPVSSSFSISHTVEPVGCGDGARDFGEFGPPESCDDGGNEPGDGCSDTCTVEPGWDCQNGPCVPVVCGDGVVAGAEGCDDGGLETGDGCSDTCSVEPGYLCDQQEPSTCRPYQAEGDLCSNALPLAGGTYSMAGYIPDLQCNDTCNGVDRWFAVEVPPGYTLGVSASTTNMFGRIEAFNATYGGCGELSGANPGSQFSPSYSGGFTWINDYGSPQSLRIAVIDQESDPSENSFDLQYALKPTGCGDYYRDQYGWYSAPEACDDGNNQDDDGCSSSCQVEPSYVCSGSPSTCFIPQPGDECSMAQPLADGTYSMSGYMPELQCTYVCSGADRWFTTTVPAGQMLELDLSTISPSSYMQLFQQPMGTCDGMMYLQGGFIMQDPGSRFYWHNDMPGPATVALVLYQPEAQSTAEITVTHEVVVPHCGDGYVDGSGQYGSMEDCDDHNNLDGDSCPADCTYAP